MKKLILSLALVAIAALSASAQKGKKESDAKKVTFSVAADLGIPVGDLQPFTSFTYGGDVQVEFAAASNFGVTVSAGYLGFSGKNGVTISGGLVPLLAGGRYYFSPKVYGSAQAGMSFSTTSGGGSAFTYAPGVGFKFGGKVDLLVKYQSASKNGVDNSYVGVRAGINF